MANIELPKDAEGRDIPLDTVEPFGDIKKRILKLRGEDE